jgi:hypothetical protein
MLSFIVPAYNEDFETASLPRRYLGGGRTQ